MMSLATAPADVVVEVAHRLDSRFDILNLCLASKSIYAVLSAVLYESVYLSTVEQCIVTLDMLYKRPDIASHIRELILKPSPHPSSSSVPTSGDHFRTSMSISATMRKIASARRLPALATFIWDHDELPYFDDMWFALRICCPLLKTVSTNIGSIMPQVSSHLFDFVGLRGLSIHLKPSFYANNGDVFMGEDQIMCDRFWTMLDKCPDLEGLTIGGAFPMALDGHRLCEGRWPKLKQLALGDIAVEWGIRNPDEKRPFIAFLEAHPHLKSLSLSRHTVDATLMAQIDPCVIQLSSFSGTLQQLQALHQMHPFIEDVTLREAIITRDISPMTVSDALQRLPSLKRLKITFLLHSMYDSGNLLRSLIISCPLLEHLELTCAHKPSFQLESFSRVVKGFRKLRTMHLTVVKYPGDESLSVAANRIAVTNPRLEKFTLTFLPAAYPVPFVVPYLPIPLRARDSGKFSLTCDRHGLPLSLRAYERHRLFWPLGLGQSCTTRRYESDLRPAGSPHRQKDGKELIKSLMTENTAAGEELRMILFCMFLLGLAVWGLGTGNSPTFAL